MGTPEERLSSSCFNSHAPVGARYRGSIPSTSNRLFQFTRPRGGAMSSSCKSYLSGCFNSHAPVGARSTVHAIFLFKLVSIHTPPWGRDRTSKEPYKIRPSKGIFANIGTMFAKMHPKYTKMSKFF